MALYTMEIPDPVVATVTASVCMEHRYDDNKLVEYDVDGNVVSTETQDDFTRRMIIEVIRNEIKRCVFNYQSVQMQGELDTVVSAIS
jgi:hypothetical protein